MKILAISNLYPPEVIGGYEVQCSEAVDGLRRLGHDVRVLTTVPRRPIAAQPESHVLRLLRTPDVYSPERVALRSPFWEFESNLLNPDNVYILLEILQAWEPDVCYLWNLVAVGGLGILAALEQVQMPWVWHLGDSIPADLCNFGGELQALGAQVAEQMSGRLIVCSRIVMDAVDRVVPIEGRTRMLPNWVLGTAESVERSYFEGRHLRMVFAGRVAEEKGVFILPEVVARLVERGHTNLSLEIFGGGDLQHLTDLVDEYGVADHVTQHGPIPKAELRQRFRQADVLVFPTGADDAMPMVPLEAAAEGCVPIIPTVSGISEWLIDGVNCLKADATADGYVEVVARVLDRKVALEEISRRAVRSVHSDFDIQAVLPAVERELILAAAAGTMAPGRSTDVQRLALVADAILRRYVMEMYTSL